MYATMYTLQLEEMMTKSDALTLRIDRELKNKGNLMLKEMGITPSALYHLKLGQRVLPQTWE